MSAPAFRIEGPRGSIEADWVPGRTWLSSYCGTPGLLFDFYLLTLHTNHVYYLLQEEPTQRSMVF